MASLCKYVSDITLSMHNLSWLSIRKVALTLFMFSDSVVFVQVLILTTSLFLSEILRVTGKNDVSQNQAFSDLDRMRFINQSHMASPNLFPNFNGWNSPSHEVST